MKNCLYVLLFLIFTPLEILGKIKLASIFTDNMVLQQCEKVKIWGNASPNVYVYLEVSWDHSVSKVKADSCGRWEAFLVTPKGGYNLHNIKITDSTDCITLNNILIGEVWLCSGQSNMEMPMANDSVWNLYVDNANAEIANANFDNIRFLKVNRNESFKSEADILTDGWYTCNPSTVGSLSAVAYFFGKKVNQFLDMPVGLIVSAYGGSPIQSWLPSTFQADSFYSDDYNILLKSLNSGVDKPHYTNMSCLFNAMISPLLGYNFKGCLWYQGEANVGDEVRYSKMMKDLIASWRKLWKKDFPFYYVQLAPFVYPDNQKGKWANFAFNQEVISDSISNAGIAIISDLGDSLNIHPGKKKLVGERLAKIALERTYNEEVKSYSPRLQKVSSSDGVMVLKFNNAYNGLYLKDSNNEFEISEDNIHYYYPQIKIIKDCILLSSPSVNNPVYIKYGWNDKCVSNIYNSENLPLGPFFISILE